MSLREILQFGGAFHLLDTIYKIAFLPQFLYCLLGGLEVFPVYAVLSAKSCLMYFCIRWRGGNAAQINTLYPEGIA